MVHNTALLVMDMQIGILARFPEQSALLERVAEAIAVARKKGLPVIFVRLAFRTGMPEISGSNLIFSGLKQHLAGADLQEFARLHPQLDVQENDIIVEKKRVSAFSGSDLEVVLRSNRITHLVLTGYATSGIVLSTVREAADKDYRISVLSDGCADADPVVQETLMERVFPRQADVHTIAEWAD